MFAIIETGGKQYRVAQGDKLEIEKVDHEAGSSFEIHEVLMTSDGSDTKIGMPYLKGLAVTAQVIEHGKDDKIRVYKMKAKKRYQKTQGHRQNHTVIEITHIGAGKTKPAAPKAEAKAESTEEKAPAKKPAVKKTVKKEE